MSKKTDIGRGDSPSPKKPRQSADDRPLLKRDFDRFKKTEFAPLVRDVAALKTDVAGLKTDVAGLKTDVAGLKTSVTQLNTKVAILQTDMSEVKRELVDLRKTGDQRHREIITTLDHLVSIYKGSQDKLIVHDVRIGDLEGRVDRLESR